MVSEAQNRATEARHQLLTAEDRPPKTEVNAEAIPDTIRQEIRWVCWEWKRTKNKWTKRPIQPDGKAASSTDPTTWTTFAAALEAYKQNPDIAGIGFVLGDGYAGVDLDCCVDPETGEAAEYVAEVTERLDSYAEVSPSKTGVKVLVRGAKPKGRTQSRADAPHECECYDGARFFTVTGQRWEGTPETVEHRTDALEWFFFNYIDTKKKTPSRPETVSIDCGGDDVETAREALANITATYASTYGDWVRVGMACRSVHPSALLDDWVAWSRDGNGYESDDDCREKWEKLTPDGSVGIGTLVYLAKLSGWTPPRKVRVRKQRQEANGTQGDDQAADGAPEQEQRPEVLASLNEGFVADQVVRHLGAVGWESPWVPEFLRETVKVYSRGGQLVHAVASEDPNTRGQLVIRPLPLAIVRERITQACQVVVEKEVEGEIEIEPTRPPRWLLEAVHLRGWYGGHVRPLVGVIAAPTIRPDGSILQAPGYDDVTGLLYRPSTKFPAVPERPSRDDARKAIGELLEVIADFPFVDDADRSAWVCLLLSMIGRPCVTGCVPMFPVSATTRGTGKGLSVDAASQIAYGHKAPCETFTPDDAELRKRITAHAIEASPAVLFDNVVSRLGGANLDAAITAGVWSDRVLGSSKSTGKLPLQTVWMATGNNLSYGSDLARRVLPIRMATTEERPEDRTDFRHADLLGWVAGNRPRLAVAALTILRAYFVAGCPEQDGGAWGSFEAWSRIIRGSVVWAGAADPMATRETARESDDSQALLGMLIHGLAEAGADADGLTAKEIERLAAHRPDEAPTCPTLVEAVAQICGDRPNARRIGARLRSYAGRYCGGRRIVADKAHNNVTRWAVRGESGGHENETGDMGDIGFSHVPHESPRKTRDEMPVGGHGGHDSRPYAYGSEKKHSSKENQKENASGNAAGECPPCPPSPPQPSAPCPRCGGRMVRLPETPVVDGWANLDCQTPGCGHVKPDRVVEGRLRA